MSRLTQSAPDSASASQEHVVPHTSASASIDRWTVGALLLAALSAVPIITVLVSAPMGGMEAITHLARTVLGRYITNTALLMVMAGGLALVIGTGCAWLVTAARFPGRRVFAWALVLPLALPSYIAAYVYADLLDFAGPVQSALRGATGWQAGDYWFPDIRSLGGGAFVLGIVLFPYVYLLARAGFSAQSTGQFHAARSLGAGPARAFWRVALPAARPAIAGGLALVLMEVLADFGVAQYFAIPTFSTGIFRSWLSMGDKQAALKLAAIMLLFVIALIMWEARSRKGLTTTNDGLARQTEEEPLIHLNPRGRVFASIVCAIPVLLGFVIPAAHLVGMAMTEPAIKAMGDLPHYISGSLWLGAATAIICVMGALILAFAKRRSNSALVGGAIRISTLGYALPGALLAVGLLAPLGALDVNLSLWARDSLGYTGGLILSGTSTVLIYALSVRFLTVAFNSVEGGMSKIPESYDAAARSLGARSSRVLRQIYAPLLSPSLAAAAALVLIDTLRELPATLILRPFNLETLATRTYRLASDERLVEASIPALILLAVGLIPVLMLTRTGRR